MHSAVGLIHFCRAVLAKKKSGLACGKAECQASTHRGAQSPLRESGQTIESLREQNRKLDTALNNMSQGLCM